MKFGEEYDQLRSGFPLPTTKQHSKAAHSRNPVNYPSRPPVLPSSRPPVLPSSRPPVLPSSRPPVIPPPHTHTRPWPNDSGCTFVPCVIYSVICWKNYYTIIPGKGFFPNISVFPNIPKTSKYLKKISGYLCLSLLPCNAARVDLRSLYPLLLTTLEFLKPACSECCCYQAHLLMCV